MYRHTCVHIHTYTHAPIHAYMHTHIHTHAYAHVCTDKKILATTPQRVKQYHRRTYASICICMHTHTYTHIHICAQPVANVFADVYVGGKTHLCNIHTCPCPSAQNTCKVHVTLTAKKYTYTYTYTHILTQKLANMRARTRAHTRTHTHDTHDINTLWPT